MGSDDDRSPRPDRTPGDDTSGEAGSTREPWQHGYGLPEGDRSAQSYGAPEGPDVPWYARPGAPGPYGAAGPYGYSGAPGPYGSPAPYGPLDPYQPPAPGWVPAHLLVRPTNALAIASLVLGIIWLYWFGSILALVFGYVAKRQILERGEQGRGLATAGIVLGWIGIATFMATAAIWVVMLRPGGSW